MEEKVTHSTKSSLNINIKSDETTTSSSEETNGVSDSKFHQLSLPMYCLIVMKDILNYLKLKAKLLEDSKHVIKSTVSR